MGYIRGEAREQTTMFPVTLDELIPADHLCRVIEAFAARLDLGGLGFVRAEPAETGRPGYDPRDLLKLYLYGYLQQTRSSRRLEAECCRNVEVMWLLRRVTPDYKSIAEFRRMHREAITEAAAELVRFAREVGLVRGEWVAIDGSKFRAVSSAQRVRERDSVQRYLDQMESADEQDEVVIEPTAVQTALEKLKSDPEPEARFMRTANGKAPAYNVQTAVDAAHALIVAHKVTTEANDQRSLLPMAEAAKQAVGNPASLNAVADAGYFNGEQVERCEAEGIVPHVPANRSVNNQGDGKLFDRTAFVYDEKTDTFRCPAQQTLTRKQLHRKNRTVIYEAKPVICASCPLKANCTTGSRRLVQRHLHEAALQRMEQRTTANVMRLRKSIVEHPFATLKYRIFGHPRFLLRGLGGAQTEISLATMVYNLKRMQNVLGTQNLAAALAH
jgi:transposase